MTLPHSQGRSVVASIDRTIIRINGWVIGIMLMVMLALVCTNVVGRYFFLYSFGWIEEVSRYLMIWIVFLGAGLALREGMHVAVTLFADLSMGLKPVFKWAAWILTFLFFAALAWYGYKYAMFAARQRSTMLQLPMWTIYLAVPIGSVMCIVHMVLDLLNPKKDAEEAVEVAE